MLNYCVQGAATRDWDGLEKKQVFAFKEFTIPRRRQGIRRVGKEMRPPLGGERGIAYGEE